MREKDSIKELPNASTHEIQILRDMTTLPILYNDVMIVCWMGARSLMGEKKSGGTILYCWINRFVRWDGLTELEMRREARRDSWDSLGG